MKKVVTEEKFRVYFSVRNVCMVSNKSNEIGLDQLFELTLVCPQRPSLLSGPLKQGMFQNPALCV